MSLAVTAWRLKSADGQCAQCWITQRDDVWHLMVTEGKQITIAERCSSDDAALARANEIWPVLIEQGWGEPRH